MTVQVDVSHLENSTEMNELITYTAKNCKGFVGAHYNEDPVDEGFVYAYFYFKTEEDAIMFNLKDR